ncbi:MAG: hypothetical protein IT165_14215 [Bryobacterales bacterium]|nr:hypothetical protein [Bryobacterales bacterium]
MMDPRVDAIIEAVSNIYGFPQAGVRRALATVPPPSNPLPHHSLLDYYSVTDCRIAGWVPYNFAIRGSVRQTLAISPEGATGLHIPVASACEVINQVAPSGRQMPANIPLDHVAQCVALLLSGGARIWDDDIHRLLSVQLTHGSVHATFTWDRYFSYRLTAGLMREEMTTGRLLLRNTLAPTVRALTDFQTRLTAGGVQLLCAFAREDDFVLPLQVRSSRVGEAAGCYGVVPMAYHQGAVEPSATALREVVEELFGGEENSPAYLDHPAVRWLLSHRSLVHLEATAFFLNLVHGNYDFAMLLAVLDPEFWRQFGGALVTSWESEAHLLVSSRDHQRLSQLLKAPNWEPQTLGTLVEGLIRLREIAPERTADLHLNRLS